MNAPYRIAVFGKTGCDKCHTLNQRVDRVLQQEEFKDFEKRAYDVETEEGIVAFSEAECINPSRIPALLVMGWNGQTGDYEPLPNRQPGRAVEGFGRSRLYQYLGVQTDYRDEGRGVITPKMVAGLLAEARA